MQVKLINLNLWLGGLRLEEILKFLSEEKPDILLVQEAYNSSDKSLDRRFHSIEVLKEELGFEHVFFSPACIAVLDKIKVQAGNAIFSRFPIIKSDAIFFDIPFSEVANYETVGGDYSQSPRNLQWAEIEIESKKFNIYNTQGIWGYDSRDNERRLNMSDIIVKEIQGRKNVVLAGDFNIAPDTQSIKKIEAHLTNILKNQVLTTFNLKQKKNSKMLYIFQQLVVDMVFVSKDIKIIHSTCPEVDISDHLPIEFTFQL